MIDNILIALYQILLNYGKDIFWSKTPLFYQHTNHKYTQSKND